MSEGGPRFIIIGLPRSRTAWISEFLSYDWRQCGHDLAVECASIADFARLFRRENLLGTVETAGMLAWPYFRKRWPETKLVVVRRPLGEVIQSFRRKGYEPDVAELEERAGMLDALSAEVGVQTIQYRALDYHDCCAWLFQHCLDLPMERWWWQLLAKRNVQVDLGERFALLSRDAARIAALKREVALACRS